MSDYMITREALDNFYAWVSEAQQLRLILTDLIAELAGDDGDGHELTPGGEEDSCLVCEYIDRAEARLSALAGAEAESKVGGDE